MKRIVLTALVAAVAAGSLGVTGVSAQSAASSREISYQGGMGNTQGIQVMLPRRNKKDREMMAALRELRNETLAKAKANGGVLPESERVIIQARLDALQAEYATATN